jgi:hypothetical protein
MLVDDLLLPNQDPQLHVGHGPVLLIAIANDSASMDNKG